MYKKITLFTFICLLALAGTAQNKNTYTILLSGASFAEPNNKWSEMGCRALHATPINRVVSAESITHTANRMLDDTLYTPEGFDNIDVFIPTQVHEKDVYDEANLKEDYKDYKTPLDASDYAVCYDYVIERYISDCYNQEFSPKSRYYNTHYGKPASIVLCTHWYDSRPIFNTSVRKLAEGWGFPVVEFGKYIGFSKDQRHPVTGKRYSLIYAGDSQETYREVFEWHPPHGEHSFIQQYVAAILANTLREILLPKGYINE